VLRGSDQIETLSDSENPPIAHKKGSRPMRYSQGGEGKNTLARERLGSCDHWLRSRSLISNHKLSQNKRISLRAELFASRSAGPTGPDADTTHNLLSTPPTANWIWVVCWNVVNEAEDYEIAETGSIQFDETLKEKLKFCQISFFASEIDVEFEF